MIRGSYGRRYSTGFTSVHGERPSAEYAKLRKESLESEFGQTLGTYSSKSFSATYRFGPFLALYRAAIVSFHVVKLSIWQLFIRDIKKRAIKVLDDITFHSDFMGEQTYSEILRMFCMILLQFRETLIQLGPFYVKVS